MKRNSPAGGALDPVDRRLLLALSRDGRRTAADLAKDLGLSRQAVAERIRDLERREVIRGYPAHVDPAALRLALRAQVRLALSRGVSPEEGKEIPRPPPRRPPAR